MSFIYATGFEHGVNLSSTAGSGLTDNINGPATWTTTASAARSGSYGLRAFTDGTNTFGTQQLIGNVNSRFCAGTMQWRAHDKPTTQDKDVFYALCPISPNSLFFVISYSVSTNKLQAVFVLAGTGIVATQAAANTVTTDQWYRIDWLFDATAGTFSIDWSIDGVKQTQVTYGSGLTPTNFTNYRLSANPTGTDDAHGNTWDFDDVILGNDISDYPIGPVKILGATADQSLAAEHQSITTTQWDTTPDFSAFTNFTGQTETTSRGFLDDLNTTDGIRMNNAGAIAGNARWPVADPSGDPGYDPLTVSLITASREASTGANNAIFRTYLDGLTIDHFNGDPAWGTTVNYLRSIMNTRPGGGKWMNIDAKDMRFEADSTGASPAIWLSGFYYEVVYPEIAGKTFVRYRIGKNLNSATVDMDVKLYQGSLLIATWRHTGLAQGFVYFEQSLLPGQTQLITDTTDLRLRFVPTVT